MTAPAAVNRKGRKYDQVLDGARKVFMTDGFEGASVDDIARMAGVSKATLYSYFPDKRLLFTEVATTACRRQAESAIANLDMTCPPRAALGLAGRHLTGFLLSDIGQRIFRICMSEAERFPELGREFFKSGPALVRETLVEYFQGAIARGELKIDDLELAADQFAELCKADLWPSVMFKTRDSATPADIDRVVDGAVETFMARYGA